MIQKVEINLNRSIYHLSERYQLMQHCCYRLYQLYFRHFLRVMKSYLRCCYSHCLDYFIHKLCYKYEEQRQWEAFQHDLKQELTKLQWALFELIFIFFKFFGFFVILEIYHWCMFCCFCWIIFIIRHHHQLLLYSLLIILFQLVFLWVVKSNLFHSTSL